MPSIPSPPRRQLLQQTAAALLLPVLGACSAPVSAMRVGSIVFPGYEDLFLARELGLLNERRVRLVELLSNTDTLRALAAGQLEAATLKLDELLTARADGVNLRAVLVLDVSEGADAVLARGTITLQTLAGKRVAVEDRAAATLLFNALLQAAGLEDEQVHKVPAEPDRAEELFDRGLVDAVVTSGGWTARLENKGAQRIFDSRSVAGSLIDVLAVRSEALAIHGPSLRHLLQGHFAALAQLREAPQRCAALMAARLRAPAADVLGLYRGLRLPDLAQNRSMLLAGGQVDQTARALQNLMQRNGLLPQVPMPQVLADPGYLPL